MYLLQPLLTEVFCLLCFVLCEPKTEIVRPRYKSKLFKIVFLDFVSYMNKALCLYYDQ